MGQCVCHTDIETSFLCMKYNKYLCEECLKCQDPDLYCKFRSSCPIWFLQKHREDWEAEEKTEKEVRPQRVVFDPDGKEISVPAGTTLLEAAQSAAVIRRKCANEILEVRPGQDAAPSLGLAIDPQTLEPTVASVDNAPPRGISGSGMIDLMSEMLIAGIIDRSGKFSYDKPHRRIQRIDGEPAYVLAFSEQTPMAEDLIFTESDLKNLIYSKGAVFAGFSTLLAEAGLDFSMVERFIITGGFGQYLDIEKAVRIGLLPDIERGRFAYLGNSPMVTSMSRLR